MVAETYRKQQAPQLLTKEWYELDYHPTQAELWRCDAPRTAVRAGRGSGKSTICFRKLVKQLPIETWHGDPGRYAYVAPTRDQAKRIAWDKFKNLIPDSWRAKDPSETELIIYTIWGSELHILGFDKPQRIEGVQWDGVVVDESADIKPNAVDLSVEPALTVKRGFLWRIGVPKRSGAGATEFRKICDDPKKGYTYFGWSSADFKHIGTEQIERLRKTLSPKDFQEQIEGKSVQAGGRAFHEFVSTNPDGSPANVDSSVTYDPTRPIVVGSDFNVDPMAWTLNHIVKGSLHTFDELWLRDTNTRKTLDALAARYGDHKAGWCFIGDAASRQRHTVATSAAPSDYHLIRQDQRFNSDKAEVRIRYPKSNPPVKDRLNSCNALLNNAAGERRWLINPQCIHLIDDLESRDVDEAGQPKDVKDKSVKGSMIGHITDAAGYVIHSFWPISLADSNMMKPQEDKGSIELSIVG